MDDVQKALKERYAHLYPLLFHRSLEKCATNGELFDILDSIPESYPLVWDENNRRWQEVQDLLQEH